MTEVLTITIFPSSPMTMPLSIDDGISVIILNYQSNTFHFTSETDYVSIHQSHRPKLSKQFTVFPSHVSTVSCFVTRWQQLILCWRRRLEREIAFFTCHDERAVYIPLRKTEMLLERYATSYSLVFSRFYYLLNNTTLCANWSLPWGVLRS